MNGVRDRKYFRPVPCDRSLPGALHLAGGLFGFREIQVLSRHSAAEIVPAEAVRALYPEAEQAIEHLCSTRKTRSGTSFEQPRIMGIVNVTPDSFSDGGLHDNTSNAVEHGMQLLSEGADVLDIGGESTRPGAEPTSPQEEANRVLPVIEGLIAQGCDAPISIDTRNASVARQAIAAGARLFNDVSALMHDPASMEVASDAGSVCLMHAAGDPQTMQHNPRYENVLLDVYDFLEYRVAACEMAGIGRERLFTDPGIGFGKTIAHNLALLRGMSLFHTLGCPVLLGASRKGFIGRLGNEQNPKKRAPGSIAAGLDALNAGVQVLRVHDVAETVQALRVWLALRQDEADA